MATIITHHCKQHYISVMSLYQIKAADQAQHTLLNIKQTVNYGCKYAVLLFLCFGNQSGSKFSLAKLYIQLNSQQMEWKK